MIQILFKLSSASKKSCYIFSLKPSVELYENVSEFCLVMANGSCPLPRWECSQAQGTFYRQMLCLRESVLKQGVTLPTTQREQESSGVQTGLKGGRKAD